MQRSIATVAFAGVKAATLTLTGCGVNGADTDTAESPTVVEGESKLGEGSIALENAVVRAKPAADTEGGSDATTIYGSLRNRTGDDMRIKGFSTSLGESTAEIHEMVDGQMRKREEEIFLPGHGTYDIALNLNPQQHVAISGVPVEK